MEQTTTGKKLDFRYEGIYDSKYKRNIQEAVEHILSCEYGTTITHSTLGKILGFNVDDELQFINYRNIMNKVKNIVLPYGRILKGVAGVGYYLLKPKHFSSYCYRTYIQRTQRMLAKSKEVLGYVPLSELSDERKLEYKEMESLNIDLIDNVESTIKTSDYYDHKRYYDNLED